MAARRTPRQVVLDSMAEVRDFQPEVRRLIEEFGGRCMHVHPATVRSGRTITPTSEPWPDLTIWFPDCPVPRIPGLYLVELKAHGKEPKRGQPELFESLGRAGSTVHIWEPRDLDDLIPMTLGVWSGQGALVADFVPRSPSWRKKLADT